MITATLHGEELLRARIRMLQAKVKSALEEATTAGAEVVRDEARTLAPRRAYETDAGHLADNSLVQVVKSTPTTCKVRVGPGKAHFYGRFLETGTIKMAARPFLRPALDSKVDEAIKTMAHVLKRELT